MKHKALTVGEIEVVVEGMFTTHHELNSAAGILGKITFPAFSQQGKLTTADGRKITMQKPRWLETAYEMTEGDTLRGRADQPSLFARHLEIAFGAADYVLEPQGTFKMGWYLKDPVGNILVEIQPRGIFKQGALLTIKGPVEADMVAFAYYLYHMRRQEEAAGAAAATS